MKKVFTLKFARALFLLNALIWAGLGVETLLRLSESAAEMKFMMGVIGIMMFGNAAAMLLSAWMIASEKPIFLFFVLGILAVNILLTFTDQVGLMDWITVLIDIVLLGFWFLRWRSLRAR